MELRLATMADLPVLRTVMDAAIAGLQKGFLSEEQIESSRQRVLRALMEGDRHSSGPISVAANTPR